MKTWRNSLQYSSISKERRGNQTTNVLTTLPLYLLGWAINLRRSDFVSQGDEFHRCGGNQALMSFLSVFQEGLLNQVLIEYHKTVTKC